MSEPLLMTEEFWADTQFSIVRRFGAIKISGIEYVIVNKEGKDIFECSDEAEKAGRDKAIEPGEPCDLIQRALIPIYKRLGRAELIRLLIEHPELKTVKEVEMHIKTQKNTKKHLKKPE